MLRPHKHLTGNPSERRCIKCGEVRPRGEFISLISEARARTYSRRMNDVPGIDLITGQTLRGYRRSKQNYHAHILLCQECNQPAAAKRYTPSAAAMLTRMKAHKRLLRELRESVHVSTVLVKSEMDKRFLFIALSREMLSSAKSKVYLLSRNHRAKYPATWIGLLNLKQRHALYRVYIPITWRNTNGERPFTHMDKPEAMPAAAPARTPSTAQVVHDIAKRVRRSSAQMAQAAQAALNAEQTRLTQLRLKRELKQKEEAARPPRPWQVRAW